MFYILDDNCKEELAILCQLRIVAENSFCTTADDRGHIIELFTDSQLEIEKICADNIKMICDKAKKHGIYVNAKYLGYVVEY